MIRGDLMPHQAVVLDFIKDKPYHGILMAYGLGKTKTVLAHIEQMQFNRVLVVSSKTALESTWVDEIRKWSDYKAVVMLGTRQQKLASLNYGMRISQISSGYQYSGVKYPTIFLLNFDGVKSVFNQLVKWGRDTLTLKDMITGSYFDYIVCDESTRIKDSTTIRTKVLWELAKYIPNRAILTGWPVTESVADIYAQIRFLDLGATFGKKYFGFMDEYFVKMDYSYKVKKKSVPQILEKIKPFCIHVENKHLKLPPSVYNIVPVDQTPEQYALLDKLKTEFRAAFGRVVVDTQHILTMLTKSLQICDGFILDSKEEAKFEGRQQRVEAVPTNKYEILFDLFEGINIYRNKVVVWFNFLHPLHKVVYFLKKEKIPVLTLTGETENPNLVVNQFQQTKKYNILLVSIKKGAESITLTGAANAIYFSNPWSGDLRQNSEARIRRKGSEGHASIIYTDLITKNSVEGAVYRCLKQKANLIKSLKEDFLSLGQEENGGIHV